MWHVSGMWTCLCYLGVGHTTTILECLCFQAHTSSLKIGREVLKYNNNKKDKARMLSAWTKLHFSAQGPRIASMHKIDQYEHYTVSNWAMKK